MIIINIIIITRLEGSLRFASKSCSIWGAKRLSTASVLCWAWRVCWCLPRWCWCMLCSPRFARLVLSRLAMYKFQWGPFRGVLVPPWDKLARRSLPEQACFSWGQGGCRSLDALPGKEHQKTLPSKSLQPWFVYFQRSCWGPPQEGGHHIQEQTLENRRLKVGS